MPGPFIAAAKPNLRGTEDVLDQALAWAGSGQRFAVATVVETWKSAPRPVGSQLVVNERRQFVGSVSGGCVESAVLQCALELMGRGGIRQLEFGVSRDEAFDVGLACGGRVRVLVEAGALFDATLATLCRHRAARRSIVLVTDVRTGQKELVHPLDEGVDTQHPAVELAREAAREDDSRLVKDGRGRELFLHVHSPPLRLCIIGAVHIAQALALFAHLHGFEVHVIDPRAAFASTERFPGVSLHEERPGDALRRLGVDSRTAVVTLVHDPKLDDPALMKALEAGAFYVGALGSRRTHRTRLARLQAAGLSPVLLDRIHAPVGLDIGARTAAEIATSIMAELVAERRRRAPS